MGQVFPTPIYSITEYLRMEASSEIKHEYAAGNIFAMAGASERHNRIAGNLFAHLHAASKRTNCTAYVSDMRVRIDPAKPNFKAPSKAINNELSAVIYYPDLMVCCEADDNDAYLKQKPCLIVEVLSESTERIDRGEKLHNYQLINSLQAYVLISQDAYRVDVYRRMEHHWLFESLSEPTDVLKLDCPPTAIELAEIYERVVFDVT